ncbi:hypothetical protein [Allosphingosinicella sp.]|jgi:transcription initiation factor IIE alpha subunit|uniref:hypothetical protein n=1 Tax=Allosphingosinicella sp. TaxID=2823234 RepID=UPI002EF65AAC
MAAIDVGALGTEVAEKIVEILSGQAKKVASYAKAEGRKLAVSAAEIAELRLRGEIDDTELALQLEIQKNASKAVLMTIKGVSKIAVEQAINGAMDILRGAIGRATGLG